MYKIFLLICIAGFFAILSSTMSKSPTLPLYAHSLGIPISEIGFIAASSTIIGIFTNIVAGRLSDIYGRKKLLLLSGFFFTSAPILYFFAGNGFLLAIVRAYHGLATAIFTPVSFALIADIYKKDRGVKMGLFSSSTLYSRLIAPSLAGYLITFNGFHAVFITCGLSGLIALLLFIKTPRIEEDRRRINKSFGKGFRKVFSLPLLLMLAIINASIYFGLQGIETFLPLLAKDIGIDPFITGIIFTVEMGVIAFLKPFMGIFSDKLGRDKPIIFGLVLSSLGILPMFFINNVYIIFLSIIVFAIGVSAVTASLTPLASELVEKEYYGVTIGALETIKDIGQAMGPIILGITISTIGYKISFLIISTILLATLILFKTCGKY